MHYAIKFKIFNSEKNTYYITCLDKIRKLSVCLDKKFSRQIGSPNSHESQLYLFLMCEKHFYNLKGDMSCHMQFSYILL